MNSAAVNRPTDVKQKEKDVNQKLQVYGILHAFSNGKVPSNQQIDVALNSFMDVSFMKNPSKKLSQEGQSLVYDFRDVVEQAKILLLTKNEGNIFQDFIWQTKHLDVTDVSLPETPVDKDTAREHGGQALEELRTLGVLIITNGQFRKLLHDATIIIRDILGDAAQKAANKVKPSEEALAQIDQPADDNVWHEVPRFSRDNIKDQIKSTFSQNKPVPADDPSGSRDPKDVGKGVARYGSDSGVDVQSGMKSGVNNLQNGASSKAADDAKEKARISRERTLNYIRQKMPQDSRERTIWRLKKMVVEIQGHPNYIQAINTLLGLAETYVGHGNTLLDQSVGSVQGARKGDALRTAEADLKKLIERFANNTSTDDLWRAINQIYRDADQDPQLKDWFKQIDAFIRKCLGEQGYIMEDSVTEDWNSLQDRGNFLLRDRYRNHTDRILDEVRFLANQFDEDPLNRRFAEACRKLFIGLGNDESGKPTFKPHLVKDLSEIILPALFEDIRYVPVPRIEYTDPKLDVVVENLVIESDNLMPNIVEFASDNYFRWGRKGVANRSKNSIMISISGVQMDFRDVGYYIKWKEGFPAITDMGLADIFLGGSGLSFKIKMSTADKDKHKFFKIDHVNIDVKNFNIKLKQSRHKFLFAIFKPIMLSVLRPALQKALQKNIRDRVNQVDELIYSIKVEADRLLSEAQYDPDHVPNAYSRFVTAAHRKFLDHKQRSKISISNKKANLDITQRDLIFPDIKFPSGTATKAAEYRELATKGDKWECPVFSIGSAEATSNLPGAGEIIRKEHPVTEGGVRDQNNSTQA